MAVQFPRKITHQQELPCPTDPEAIVSNILWLS